MSKNFWEEVNEDIYWNGFNSLIPRLHNQYQNVSDEEYERIHKNLATQALKGDFSTVNREEGYYLICEEYTPQLAKKALF